MAKWAFITTIFYILLVSLFLIPSAWCLADTIAGKDSKFSDFFLYPGWSNWFWWIITGVIVLIQTMLLLYPVRRAKEQPKPQRTLSISIVIAGILFSLLLLGVFASASAAIWGEDQIHPSAVIFWLVFIPMSWFIWAFIFYRFAKTTNADSFMICTLKWLITGSILELLVAVPCHVVVRHKNVCCAQGLTFYGIAAGLAVMALAFGPGIVFLILKRARAIKSMSNNIEHAGNKSILPANVFTLAKMAGVVILMVCFIYMVCVLEKFNDELTKVSQNQVDLKHSLEHIIFEKTVRKDKILVGRPFPVLNFKAVDGNDISLVQLKGKFVLIDFWATWCGPCTHEIPGLVKLYNQYHNKGFEIIGISLDSDINALKKFLTSNQVIWPQYFDGKEWGNEISSRFGIESIPSTVLLDKDGSVIRIGLRGETLRETVEKLLNPTSQNNKESTSSAVVYSQENLEMVGMQGKDLTAVANQSGVYGTKGVAAPGNVPGARYGSVTWIDGSGNLWLFGGMGYDVIGNFGDLNDLWKFDGTNWTWVSGSNAVYQSGVYGTKGVADINNMPGARDVSISWIDRQGNLWLFGGYGTAASGNGGLNDLWKFDGTNWTWVSGSNVANQSGVYGTKGVAAPSNVPSERGNGISWIDRQGNLWLFGGGGRGGRLNDLWKFDGTNWTWVSGSNAINQNGVYGTKGVADINNVPGGRQSSVSWIDVYGNLWLFGGTGYDASGSDNCLNDLWKFDGTNWTWVSGSNTTKQRGVYGTKGVVDINNMPGARYSSVSRIDGSGNLWLFGGNGYDVNYGGYLNDLWKFDGTNWTWVSGSNVADQSGVYGTKGVAAPGNVPGGRHSSISWIDGYGNLWLFGGIGYAASGSHGYLNDLWKFDGTNWTWVSGSNVVD